MTNFKSLLMLMALLLAYPLASYATTYNFSTCTQNATATTAGATDQEILHVMVDGGGGGSVFRVCQMDFTMNNSSTPTNAKLWYTGTSGTFATTTLLGTVVSPTGTISFNFTAAHDANNRHYWLTYDIPAGAPDCSTYDASMPVGSVHHTASGGTCPATATAQPSTPNPDGNRKIEVPGCWNYCTSNASSTTYSHISNVLFNTINQSSSTCVDYTDYTGVQTSVMQGSTHTLTITKINDCTGSTQYTGRFSAWIDWNNDGDFDDAGEQVLTDAAAGNGPESSVIVIPLTSTVGVTRMRCIFREGTTVAPNCGQYTNWGETEDYSVDIVALGATCTDGILNQDETGIDCGGATCPPCHCTNSILDGDETGIDCGGSCDPCGDCSNGIQDGTETGIDCGGDCISCTAQPTGTTTDDCTAPASNIVYCTSCEQIGTSAYNLYSPAVTFAGTSTFTAPTTLPTAPCPAVGATGTWLHVSLDAGVTKVQMQFTGANSIDPGNSTTYAAAYQGTCASLTYNSCMPALDFISGSYGVYNVAFDGLDSNEDLWVFMYNGAGKNFDLNFNLVGTCPATAPPNTTCATATPASGGACNLGAPGATFTTPGAAATACTGGNWGSNENTTFYTINVSSTTATLEVSNITCNDGTAGAAQFGIWESCADVGTYGANFLGCAVGTATLSLTGMDPNNTYIIAADGFAGDNCKWDFSGTNLVLPIELHSLIVTPKQDRVKIEWITLSEINNEYFTIEKSLDTEIWEEVKRVPGHLNSSVYIGYTEYDESPYLGTSYYRLKQTDVDGKFEYSPIISVEYTKVFDNLTIYPNPISDNGYLTFTSQRGDNINIEIYNMTGQSVQSYTTEIVSGLNKLNLNTNGLESGIYFITIDTGSGGGGDVKKLSFSKK